MENFCLSSIGSPPNPFLFPQSNNTWYQQCTSSGQHHTFLRYFSRCIVRQNPVQAPTLDCHVSVATLFKSFPTLQPSQGDSLVNDDCSWVCTNCGSLGMEVRRKHCTINAISPSSWEIEQKMNKQNPTPALPFMLPLLPISPPPPILLSYLW